MAPDALIMDRPESSVRRIGGIPIRNLWLLMLYASQFFMGRQSDLSSVEDNPDDIPELVANYLCAQVERRMRRSPTPGYVRRHEVLNRLRGHVDLLKTERGQLLERGKLACVFDELTTDTPRNRYVRAALEKLGTLVRDESLALRCRSLALGLTRAGVEGSCPSRGEMERDRPGRHDAADLPMVEAARLAFELALPTEDVGNRLLSPPELKERKLHDLYEKAVAGFCQVHLGREGWEVHAQRVQYWQTTFKTPGMDGILPNMVRDIVLTNHKARRRLVVDTKCMAMLKPSRGFAVLRLASSHIYQMYAYLRSQEGRGDTLADRAEGVLLYPATDVERDERMVVQGHSIRFMTVNLAGSTRQIIGRLLAIVDGWTP